MPESSLRPSPMGRAHRPDTARLPADNGKLQSMRAFYFQSPIEVMVSTLAENRANTLVALMNMRRPATPPKRWTSPTS